MDQTTGTPAHHQNIMLAVRREMGWPGFRPMNDCIAFASGRAMTFEIGSELARLSQELRKDFIYSGWSSARAKQPLGFSIVSRELLCVDVITRVTPWVEDAKAPLRFLSLCEDEHFMIDRRGSLTRIAGRPSNIAAGRRIAMQRVRATAAAMGDRLLDGNRFVPRGADWIEPAVPLETIVRFN